MGKVIRIEIPSWVDERKIIEIVEGLFPEKNNNVLEKIYKLLDELPYREINFKELKREYYEAKMFY